MTKFVYTPIRDEIILADIARKNFENQKEFDKAFFKLKLIEHSEDRDAKERALNEAHDTLEKVAKYSKRTVNDAA